MDGIGGEGRDRTGEQDVASADDGSPALTVAVCTRNRGALIRATITSILDNETGHDFVLLVVDQSDDDTTADVVNEFDDPRVRLLRTDTRGIGPSRDLAVRRSTGRHVLFTDDDCRVPPNWIDEMYDALERDPAIGMIFCNVVAGPHDPSAGFIPTYERTGEFAARTVRAKNRARGIGAGMGVRRDAALRIGGFDTAIGTLFRGVVNEEGDLALRMILAGWTVFETDRVAIVHDGFRTWAQGRDLAVRNFMGIGIMYAKPVRAGRWSVIQVIAYEGLWGPLVQPLLRRQRPRPRSCWYFWRGVMASFGHPIDRATLRYVVDDQR